MFDYGSQSQTGTVPNANCSLSKKKCFEVWAEKRLRLQLTVFQFVFSIRMQTDFAEKKLYMILYLTYRPISLKAWVWILVNNFLLLIYVYCTDVDI